MDHGVGQGANPNPIDHSQAAARADRTEQPETKAPDPITTGSPGTNLKISADAHDPSNPPRALVRPVKPIAKHASSDTNGTHGKGDTAKTADDVFAKVMGKAEEYGANVDPFAEPQDSTEEFVDPFSQSETVDDNTFVDPFAELESAEDGGFVDPFAEAATPDDGVVNPFADDTESASPAEAKDGVDPFSALDVDDDLDTIDIFAAAAEGIDVPDDVKMNTLLKMVESPNGLQRELTFHDPEDPSFEGKILFLSDPTTGKAGLAAVGEEVKERLQRAMSDGTFKVPPEVEHAFPGLDLSSLPIITLTHDQFTQLSEAIQLANANVDGSPEPDTQVKASQPKKKSRKASIEPRATRPEVNRSKEQKAETVKREDLDERYEKLEEQQQEEEIALATYQEQKAERIKDEAHKDKLQEQAIEDFEEREIRIDEEKRAESDRIQ